MADQAPNTPLKEGVPFTQSPAPYVVMHAPNQKSSQGYAELKFIHPLAPKQSSIIVISKYDTIVKSVTLNVYVAVKDWFHNDYQITHMDNLSQVNLSNSVQVGPSYNLSPTQEAGAIRLLNEFMGNVNEDIANDRIRERPKYFDPLIQMSCYMVEMFSTTVAGGDPREPNYSEPGVRIFNQMWNKLAPYVGFTEEANTAPIWLLSLRDANQENQLFRHTGVFAYNGASGKVGEITPDNPLEGNLVGFEGRETVLFGDSKQVNFDEIMRFSRAAIIDSVLPSQRARVKDLLNKPGFDAISFTSRKQANGSFVLDVEKVGRKPVVEINPRRTR